MLKYLTNHASPVMLLVCLIFGAIVITSLRDRRDSRFIGVSRSSVSNGQDYDEHLPSSASSAGWDTSELSTRAGWALKPSRSIAATTKSLWRESSAPTITSMRQLRAVVELQKLGGATVILATAPNAQAISELVDGLAPGGKLLVPAAPRDPLTINLFSLILKRSSVAGWYSGTAKDSEETLESSALSGVHPMIEKYPLDQVAEAYELMHSGRVRFRVVLTFD